MQAPLPHLPPRERPLPPPEKWGAFGPLAQQRLTGHAVVALLVFSALTTLALAAWFYRAAGDPWGWRTLVALSCDALALGTAALMWRARARSGETARAHVLVGIAIMLLSLVRVAGAWTLASGVLIALTALLLVPLARVLLRAA